MIFEKQKFFFIIQPGIAQKNCIKIQTNKQTIIIMLMMMMIIYHYEFDSKWLKFELTEPNRTEPINQTNKQDTNHKN